jgi:hypothetical protein
LQRQYCDRRFSSRYVGRTAAPTSVSEELKKAFAKGEPSTQVDLTRSPRRWGMGAICVGQSLRIASVQVALGFAAA